MNNTSMNKNFKLSLVLITSLLTPSSVFAYVDPGTGSLLVTTILGFIAAASYTLRNYFYKIKNYFLKNDENPDE